MNTCVDIKMRRIAHLPKINQRIQNLEESFAPSENEAFIHYSGQTHYKLVEDELVDSSDPILVYEFNHSHPEIKFNVGFRELLISELSKNLILRMITSVGVYSPSQIDFIKQDLFQRVPVLAKSAWDEKSVSLEIFIDIRLTVTRPIRRRFTGTLDLNEVVVGSDTFPASTSSLMFLRSGAHAQPGCVEQGRSTLPRNRGAESVKKREGRLCAVCLEDIARRVAFTTKMPCSHIFHTDCIHQWLEYKKSCPLCRFEIPDEKIV